MFHVSQCPRGTVISWLPLLEPWHYVIYVLKETIQLVNNKMSKDSAHIVKM